MDISWTSGEITLISYEGEDVYFTETSDTPLNEKNSLRYGVSDGVLVIRFQEKGSLFGRQPDKKLQVMIPRSLASDLREVQADAVSANIRIEKLESGKNNMYCNFWCGCTYGTAGRQNRDRDGIW